MIYYVTVSVTGTIKTVMKLVYKSSVKKALQQTCIEYPEISEVGTPIGCNRFGQKLPDDMEIRGDMEIFISGSTMSS